MIIYKFDVLIREIMMSEAVSENNVSVRTASNLSFNFFKRVFTGFTQFNIKW